MSRVPHSWLTTALRDALRTLARRKVAEADVDDIVQVVLTEAAASQGRPEDPADARKWIYGILRNKIADHHRRPKREELVPELREEPRSEAHAQDMQEVRSLLEWAMRELPPGMDARRTLEWLLRESEGETLEEIARSEQLPPEQVRQRVSRLRRFFRERWVATAVGFAVLIALGVAVIFWPERRPLDLQADNTNRRQRLDAQQAGTSDAAALDAREDATPPVEDAFSAEDAPETDARPRPPRASSVPPRARSSGFGAPSGTTGSIDLGSGSSGP
jgi:RNA polymerase sigma factor (sigma-70 family)